MRPFKFQVFYAAGKRGVVHMVDFIMHKRLGIADLFLNKPDVNQYTGTIIIVDFGQIITSPLKY